MRLIFMLAFLLPSLVAAQATTFGGKILDMDTQEPIPNATMTLLVRGSSEKISAQTNEHGYYQITLPEAWLEGEYPMMLEAEHYFQVNGIVLVNHGAERNFHMKHKPEIREEEIKPVRIPPTSNLVFLIDISASMNEEGKIDMLKMALKHLASLLRPTDKVSIVTYSSSAQLYLPPAGANELDKINAAIDSLTCRGITMGGLGLDMAFTVAKKSYIHEGNNKVILVTDGRFTSTESRQYKTMEKLITKMYSRKIALSVFSFGRLTQKTKDNLKNMSVLGGGTYAHIESEEMAIEEMVDEANNLGAFK